MCFELVSVRMHLALLPFLLPDHNNTYKISMAQHTNGTQVWEAFYSFKGFLFSPKFVACPTCGSIPREYTVWFPLHFLKGPVKQPLTTRIHRPASLAISDAIGGYLCDRLLPSCHTLTSIGMHTHTVHTLHWNDISNIYTFEVLLIAPFIPGEAMFLTPVSYVWKNFYLPLPFVTSYWKITVISGSVGSIQNIKSLFQ